MDSTDSKSLDWKPLQVVSIKKEGGNSSKYILNYEALKDLLRTVSKLPVAIIPIVGPTRQGKSFILNYMIRYLSDASNICWIGESDAPLTGFGWKADTDPQTLGLWISKPFILKQSNGKEIAVLLIDTQGVFDDCSTHRDWSTIVGISLLVSSSLIFNIQKNLQEDALTPFESFLEYGLLAADANPESNEKPFQSLMFLIRDYTLSKSHGLRAGRDFLQKKLDIKDNQSTSAQVVRKLLNRCFKDVSCFLMPNIGQRAEEEEFNGCVDGLEPRFVEKMKEFIINMLNPEELKPKTIDNNTITGEELLEYFNTYVKVFNSDELPKPTDLIEATAKTKDLININKLKDSHLNQLKCFITKKEFVAREALNKYSDQLKTETIDTFEALNKSKNEEILNELIKILETHLDSNKVRISNENESRNEKVVLITKNLLTDSINEYNQRMDNLFDSSSSIHQMSETHEEVMQKSLDQFKLLSPYKDQSFLNDYFIQFDRDVNKSFEKFKIKFTERQESLRNAFNIKVSEAKNSYIQEMETNFVGNVLTDEEMQDCHEKCRQQSIDIFNSNSIDVNNEFDVEKYSTNLEQLIEKEFEKLVIQNQLNLDLRKRDLNDIVNESADSYDEQMHVFIGTVNSEVELIEEHENIKSQILSEFKLKISSTESTELDSLLEKLEEKINNSSDDAIEMLVFRLKNQESLVNTMKIYVRKFYREEMDKYYRNNQFLSKQNLLKNNDSVIKRIMDKLEKDRGLMSFDNYKKLIEDNVKDIFDKISADNDMNAPTLPVIGIDLGTTNSCVAFYRTDRKNASTVDVIKNELGYDVTPSVVSIRDDCKVVGNVAKDEIFSNPKNTIYSAKRLIGRNFSDPIVESDMKLWSYNVVDDGFNNPKVQVLVNGVNETFFAEQISSEVLKKMKEIAENHLGFKVSKAVVTVPAYFTDAQKEATKDAGKLAGLEVLKIINEPTAAAIAFQLNKSDDCSPRKILIYDFGGGTFDVAVLNVEKGEIKVMAVGGDTHLGGDDFDTNLVEYCLSEFFSKTGYNVTKNDPEGQEAILRLRRECEINKCKLSATNSTRIIVDKFYKTEDLSVELTRDKFEELNEDLIIKSMDSVVLTLKDSGLTKSDIDDIVLVGGSTRIPRVKNVLIEQFGGLPLNHTVDPDKAVALGAAIQAAILNGQEAQKLGHLRVVDVAPISLGVKVKDGLMSVIIPRNSEVPNTYESIYETVSDYQTTVDVEVFEGEETMAERNKLLGKFELKRIPADIKGKQFIKVLFRITDEGILRVTAKIMSNGSEQEIEIKEHKGRLTDKQLEQLIAQGK